MAKKDFSYEDPEVNITREHCPGEVGGGATTVYGKFHTYAASLLKAVHCRVTTAGTSTDHKLDVYVGTASVASVALGTSTAGSISTVLVGSNMASLEAVEVKSGADVVGKAVVSYEYEYQKSAQVTA